MAAATIVTFAAVLHRYASGIPIPAIQDVLIQINTSWAQELTSYLLVCIAKFGAAYGVRTGIDVGVDVLINRLDTPWRSKFVIFGLLAGAFFTCTIGPLGARFVWEIGPADQVSADMEIPMWIVYMAVPLGSYLMSIRFLQVTWHFIKTGELTKHECTDHFRSAVCIDADMIGHWHGGLALGLVHCSQLCPAPRRQPWSQSVPSSCRQWSGRAIRTTSVRVSSPLPAPWAS